MMRLLIPTCVCIAIIILNVQALHTQIRSKQVSLIKGDCKNSLTSANIISKTINSITSRKLIFTWQTGGKIIYCLKVTPKSKFTTAYIEIIKGGIGYNNVAIEFTKLWYNFKMFYQVDLFIHYTTTPTQASSTTATATSIISNISTTASNIPTATGSPTVPINEITVPDGIETTTLYTSIIPNISTTAPNITTATGSSTPISEITLPDDTETTTTIDTTIIPNISTTVFNIPTETGSPTVHINEITLPDDTETTTTIDTSIIPNISTTASNTSMATGSPTVPTSEITLADDTETTIETSTTETTTMPDLSTVSTEDSDTVSAKYSPKSLGGFLHRGTIKPVASPATTSSLRDTSPCIAIGS